MIEYAKLYGEPDFPDIDNEFREKFIEILRKKGLKTNTIGKKLQTLKIFLNDAYYKGINHHLKYKDRNFKTPKEETDNIYLTKDEINQFYEYDLSDKPSLERVRDLFVVACWTGGVRFSDWEKITLDRIKNNILTLVQQKTKKKVFIPVHPILLEILSKYNYNLPHVYHPILHNDLSVSI